MKLGFTRRTAVALIAAGTILSPAIGATAAQAASTPTPAAAGQPDVACPSRTICAWSGINYTGSRTGSFATSDYHSHYYQWTAVVGFNPGSIDDNSGSIIWVSSGGAPTCVNKGGWNLYNDYSWFWVSYNVGSCNGAQSPGNPP